MATLLRLSLVLLCCTCTAGAVIDVDVLVYGATPAGVLAADAAAGEDATLRVALLDPREVVGGAMSGGLCVTDFGTTLNVVGGRTRKFFEQVSVHYNGSADNLKSTFEPHVAEGIFRDYFLASKPNLRLYTSARIVGVAAEPTASSGRRLKNATTSDGDVFSFGMVIDASYEGFLLPLAGVSYTWGREPTSAYNESAAGVTDVVAHPGVYTLQPQLFSQVDPRWPNGTTIPLVQAEPPGPIGSGDNRTQAYMYRLTTTAAAGNFLQPWPKPAGYDSSEYELFRRLLLASPNAGASIIPNCANLPNGKCDANSQFFDQTGPSFSWDYPAAVAAGDWGVQQAVWDRYRDFQLGLAFFLQNDESVPAATRAARDLFGLPLDEYPASAPVPHFPPQLYVREALRMVSDFVLTQADRETQVNKTDSIAMGSYTIDVLPVSRFPRSSAGTGTGTGSLAAAAVQTLMEGGEQAPCWLCSTSFPPFQLPYRAITPRRAEATNLLVPGALSASHLAFCAVRVEPTWMALGESAGVAAASALAAGVDVQSLDVAALQARLRQLGQVLEL